MTLVAEDHYHADEHDPLKASHWKRLSHNVHIQGNLCEKISKCRTVRILRHPLRTKRIQPKGVLPTYWLGLPVQVVKQLCVAGEHAAAGRTGHKSLLGVASHVFSQTVPYLEESVTACNKDIKGV